MGELPRELYKLDELFFSHLLEHLCLCRIAAELACGNIAI